MYDFYHNFVKKSFDAKLLFTNTGSLTYEIKSENVYEEFFRWKDLFDFSDYSKGSKVFDETNEKVISKMEDGFGGVIVIEFVGLKSKMDSMKKNDGKECNTAKRVSIATEFDKLKDVLFISKIIRHKMKRILSKKHKLGTYEIGKISLSCFADKRHVLDDRIRTLVYFHKNRSQVVKRLKKIVIKKIVIMKIVIKNIVIIEKDYNN